MTRARRRSALACAVVALVVLTGCSDPTTAPVTVGSARPVGTGCRDAGFVPSTWVTVTRTDPRVLYLHPITVPAGRTGKGSADASLSAYPPLDPGLRVDSPSGAVLDATTRNAVLDRVAGSTALDGVRGLSWEVVNPTTRTRHYLVYAGATVRRGSWEVRRCAGRSVTTYRGTFTKVGRIGTGVVRCLADPERPDLARTRLGGQNRLRGAATRAACRPTPDSYRQFHDPTA